MAEDGLEKLQERLYRKGEAFEKRFERPEFTLERESDEVKTKWENGATGAPPSERFRLPLDMKLLVWGAVALSVIAMALAAVYLFSGFGSVSGRNIDISITGPESVPGGELARWDIVITNKNNVALDSADLSFYYPSGSRPVSNIRRDAIPVERKALGAVSSGKSAQETFSAFVYGAEGFEGEARAVLEYRTAGSNAIFEKSETAKIKISRAPVGVSVKMPAEVNAGRPVDIEVRYVSNSQSVLNDVALEMQWPDGFVFKSASPQPTDGILRWKIGDLAPGQEHIVKISGTFSGEDGAGRTVVARAGTTDGNAFNVYGESSASVTLRRLFLDLSMLVNDSASPVVRGGDSVGVDVSWRNNLPDAVGNATLEVALDIAAIDERTISAEKGFYRGIDHTIVWTPSSDSDLGRIAAGSDGSVHFSFRVKDAVALSKAGVKNASIGLRAVMRPEGGAPSLPGVDVSGRTDVAVKLGTTLQFTSKGLYNSGTLPGSGPLPPKVGLETAYTIVWSFTNTLNDVVNAEVRAGVPPYVRFTGVKVPTDEDVTYDAAKAEIVWRVSRVRAGAGVREPAREVSFQIGAIPSAAQLGNAPALLFGIAMTGSDESTENAVQDSEADLTTDLTRFDPAMKTSDTKVVQ